MESPRRATFFDVVAAEVGAVNARRFCSTTLDADNVSAVRLASRVTRDERGQPVPVLESDLDLAGLSLSGGGIRSAAFCLGVLQGIDAAVDDGQPQILDSVDYLSTVSGGGYIGASLVTGLMQTQGRFPFASKLDQAETLPTQHLRDFSNYLAPNGPLDWLVGIAVIMRGLLVNAVILLGIILFAAFITVLINPSERLLAHSHLAYGANYEGQFLWAITFAVLLGLGQFGYAVVANRPGVAAITTLRQREIAGQVFALVLVTCGAFVFVEVQSFVLKGLFDAAHLQGCAATPYPSGTLGRKLFGLTSRYETPWALLAAALAAFTTFGGKLVKVAQATVGDTTWTGFLKHWGSRIAVILGALIVPLALWAVYLHLCFGAIRWIPWPQGVCSSGHGPESHADLIARVSNLIGATPGKHGARIAFGFGALILILISLLVTPNANSLHSYYRDRLSRAFLWQLRTLRRQARRRDRHPRTIGSFFEGMRAKPSRGLLHLFGGMDRYKLSHLKRLKQGNVDVSSPTSWRKTVAYAPYLLINTSVNLEASRYLNRRGRNADSFIFTPLHVGSEATAFATTEALERADQHVDVATAMAISGAAASANMGASTIAPLTFSLAVLNIRLGYWLPNPRRIAEWSGWTRLVARIGPLYFAQEVFGWLDEWTRNVYLTDGGHFDNLGLYELLKRRCKIIIAVDAEADPPMNFESLVRLQRYARIDLGVRIDLPWEDLRRFSRTITVDEPHGPNDDPSSCIGPHIALGRIEYGPSDTGVLVYIKACISGDENDLVRDYRRRKPSFPHETTLDQFFTEEQFEVYRALGFHATKSFFAGEDRFAMLAPAGDEDWAGLIRRTLTRINVPEAAVGKIVERQLDGAPLRPSL